MSNKLPQNPPSYDEIFQNRQPNNNLNNNNRFYSLQTPQVHPFAPNPYQNPETYSFSNSFSNEEYNNRLSGSLNVETPLIPPLNRTAPPPPHNVSSEIYQWFKAVDEDGNGEISSLELQKALINTNWSCFNSETCRLMVGMFDRDKNGTIDIEEFSSLWNYINQWKQCFDQFDTDQSGNIDSSELFVAFKTFGYNLSRNFCELCIRVFDKKDHKYVNLDDFMQICVMLQMLTHKFREKDQEGRGVINIYYEDFIRMALDNTVV